MGVLRMLLRYGVAHLLAEVGERGSPVQGVALGHLVVHRHHVLGRPMHGGMLGRRGRLATLRVRRTIVKQVVRVQTALVGSSLVLDHGRLAAEAAQIGLARRWSNVQSKKYLFKQPS